MAGRGSTNRVYSGPSFGSRISYLMLSMFAAMASLYVAGRSAHSPSLCLYTHIGIVRTCIDTVIFFLKLLRRLICGKCVVDRLWQDAENRVYLVAELDRRTGQVSLLQRKIFGDAFILCSMLIIHYCHLLIVNVLVFYVYLRR